MKPLFLLTSAINTKFGVFNSEQRLAQTLKTFESINQYCPGARIILVEMGGIPLTDEQTATLKEHVDQVLTYNQDEAVRSIFDSTENWDIVKNCTEVMIFAQALAELKSQGVLDQFDRIFKLTARYELTDAFVPAYYDTVPDRIVLLHPRPSQFAKELTGGCEWQYMSRLFSWPTDQTDTIIDTYNTGFVAIATRLNEGGYIDLEHMLFKYLPRETVTEVGKIGVRGSLGPNGLPVNE